MKNYNEKKRKEKAKIIYHFYRKYYQQNKLIDNIRP